MRPRPTPQLRLAFATVLALLLAFAAGCGGGSSSSIADPRAEALSYMPRDAPIVVEVTTDPKGSQVGAMLALIRRFPFGGALLSQAQSAVDQNSDYQKTIKPLLGNPFVISPPTIVGGVSSALTVAFVARDAGKLAAAIKRMGIKVADHKGFTIYRSRTAHTIGATKGQVFLVSGNQVGVEAAIDRHESKRGGRVSDFAGLNAGLPAQALARVSGNVGTLIARDAAKAARQVPFVAAIKGYAATLSASSGGLALDVRVDTSGAALTSDQQPLPTGTDSPPLTSGDTLDVGEQDTSHSIRFLFDVGRVVSPAAYAQSLAPLAELKARTGVDILKALETQFSGPLVQAGDLQSFGIRATAKDPALVRRDLVKLTPALKSLLHARVVTREAGLTVLRGSGQPLAYGVIGDQALVGTIAPAELVRLAGAPASPLPGAHGAISLRFGLVKLLAPLISAVASQGLRGQIAQGLLQRVGDVTGYASEDARALTFHLQLGIR